MNILLIACYELGHQPLSLAWPLAFLRQAGLPAEALDLAVQPLDEAAARRADLIGLAVPMHTALRLGAETARHLRQINPRAHLCFFGLYAHLNATALFEQGLADSVLAGEGEAALTALAQALAAGAEWRGLPGVTSRAASQPPALTRLTFPLPERDALPPLARYARYADAAGQHLAGYVEASRGCLHTCLHCPIPPVYHGRFFVVPAEVVLADIAQQIAAGAQHITFGDPDFLNGPKHALAVTRALHARWPRVTFDFTAKVEHLLQHRALLPEFARLGCAFVVSAIESVSDPVLAHLRKGHTAADLEAVLAALDAAGIALQPTLVAFTPWTALEDYLALLDFIGRHDLVRHCPPVQLSIRLLLPPGSPLVAAPDAGRWLGALAPEAFTYHWTHPDPRMDRLHAQVAERVAAAGDEAPEATFAAIRALAYAAAERPLPPAPIPARRRPPPPRLTENWFC